MKMKTVNVRIKWLDFSDGGRRNLPPGPKYSTVAKFDSLKDLWPKEAWSIVLYFEKSDYIGQNLKAEMNMLVENAPQYLLNKGEEFELYEGAKLVAHGKIL